MMGSFFDDFDALEKRLFEASGNKPKETKKAKPKEDFSNEETVQNNAPSFNEEEYKKELEAKIRKQIEEENKAKAEEEKIAKEIANEKESVEEVSTEIEEEIKESEVVENMPEEKKDVEITGELPVDEVKEDLVEETKPSLTEEELIAMEVAKSEAKKKEKAKGKKVKKDKSSKKEEKTKRKVPVWAIVVAVCLVVIAGAGAGVKPLMKFLASRNVVVEDPSLSAVELLTVDNQSLDVKLTSNSDISASVTNASLSGGQYTENDLKTKPISDVIDANGVMKTHLIKRADGLYDIVTVINRKNIMLLEDGVIELILKDSETLKKYPVRFDDAMMRFFGVDNLNKLKQEETQVVNKIKNDFIDKDIAVDKATIQELYTVREWRKDYKFIADTYSTQAYLNLNVQFANFIQVFSGIMGEYVALSSGITMENTADREELMARLRDLLDDTFEFLKTIMDNSNDLDESALVVASFQLLEKGLTIQDDFQEFAKANDPDKKYLLLPLGNANTSPEKVELDDRIILKTTTDLAGVLDLDPDRILHLLYTFLVPKAEELDAETFMLMQEVFRFMPDLARALVSIVNSAPNIQIGAKCYDTYYKTFKGKDFTYRNLLKVSNPNAIRKSFPEVAGFLTTFYLVLDNESEVRPMELKAMVSPFRDRRLFPNLQDIKIEWTIKDDIHTKGFVYDDSKEESITEQLALAINDIDGRLAEGLQVAIDSLQGLYEFKGWEVVKNTTFGANTYEDLDEVSIKRYQPRLTLRAKWELKDTLKRTIKLVNPLKTLTTGDFESATLTLGREHYLDRFNLSMGSDFSFILNTRKLYKDTVEEKTYKFEDMFDIPQGYNFVGFRAEVEGDEYFYEFNSGNNSFKLYINGVEEMIENSYMLTGFEQALEGYGIPLGIKNLSLVFNTLNNTYEPGLYMLGEEQKIDMTIWLTPDAPSEDRITIQVDSLDVFYGNSILNMIKANRGEIVELSDANLEGKAFKCTTDQLEEWQDLTFLDQEETVTIVENVKDALNYGINILIVTE